MKINNIILILLLTFVLSGCSVTQQVLGEYYLKQNNYNNGYSYFKEKVNTNSKESLNHYYYARFLLAKDEFNKSIKYLKEAIKLKPNESLYYSWIGVVYGNIKQYNNERKSYLKALSIDKNNLQALTYLAHNYFEKKEYFRALEYYKKVLNISPRNQGALYNRSLVFNRLRRTPQELLSWKEYLLYYPSGLLSTKAVKQLNILGDFSFKNHLIGFKTVTLKNILFEPFSLKINSLSTSSLDVLGNILIKNENISIHIISYQLNNKNLAKEKALSIRSYIVNKYKIINKKRLKLSWFDRSRIVKINKNKYKLDDDINFITYVKK